MLLIAAVLAATVHVHADGWAEAVPKAPEQVAAGESVWSWSEECAPHRAGADCPDTVRTEVRVTAPRGRAIAGTELRWGTEAMLADFPDALLPTIAVDAAGKAVIEAPKGERAFVRAAGPALASAWIELRGTGVAIAARDAAQVTIRVDVAGQPARRARIELRATDAPPANGLAFRATGDGALQLPPIPTGYLRAIVWSEEGAPAVLTELPGELPKRISLQRGVSISGETVSERGAPIAGAAFTTTFVIPRERITIRKRVASDVRGGFALHGIPAGDIDWRASKPPLATRAEVVRVEEDLDLGPVILPKARDVRVVVTGTAGQPVAGARVRVGGDPSVRTDEQGRATLPGAPALQFEVHVEARGYLPAAETFGGEEKEPLRIALRKAAVVRARVVREDDGTPAGPGTAAVQINGRKWIADFDQSGVLEIDGLEAGRLSLELRPLGLAPFRLPQRNVASGEEIDLGTIRVSPGFAISGRVIDRASAAPLSGAVLRVLRPGGLTPALAYLRGEWVEGRATADGTFRISGLAPGVYTLWSEAAGHAPLVRSGITLGQDLADNALELGDLAISDAHALRVRCEPASRCGSEAALSVGGVDWLPLASPLADGTATIAPVPAGPAVLRLTENGGVIHERDVTITEDQALTEVRIALRGVRVSGRVTRQGKPVSGGRIRLATVADRQPPFVQLAHGTPAGGAIGNEIIGIVPRVISAGVGTDGAFEFADVAPGAFSATWFSDIAESTPQRVVIPEGQQYAMAIDLPDSGVDGVVRKRDGSVPLQTVLTLEQGGRTTTLIADPSGSFSFVGLASGPATVRASVASEGLAAEQAVTIEEGKRAFAQLTLEPRRLNDLVVLATGESGPVANVFVFVRSGRQMQASMTGADGRAVFHLPSGAMTAELSAWSPAFGWTFSPPQAVGGDAPPEVMIPLRRAPASLVVEREKGSGPVDVWSPSGFPLHEALLLLGVRSAAREGAPLRIDGLPAGTYGVAAASQRKDVQVTDRVADIRF